MNLIHAIILAIIEGLTEFLPVSSTGHMIIGSTAMGIASQPFVKVFTVAIQFGAILSVVVLYWRRFFKNFYFYIRLLVAFLPAVVFGLLLKNYIDALLENIAAVAIALIAGGFVFLFLDGYFKKRSERNTSVDDISLPKALNIGLFQVIAMVPGVSRSAATIIGGLTQGLSPTTAAEFSFFLAVPTMFAATCKSLWDYVKDEGGSFTQHEILMLTVGNVVGFIVAMIAIKAFIKFLTSHGFKVFGYYRIVVGLIILALWASGWFEGVSVGNF
ncbi:MAG: undecaprenyl-diphosphate phosphatase [Lewinellaceae bacterium]|nr:undecaprenyl-diphosphate phosphatase [Saprospiraceae bacterium]MCB0542475.1 undecaprenyl-diphosphate phosphatase [Saprospiraceae bacterium]MCB9305190.1 undecaprenyl-diphosphate phosphatase [Lewinellaceae bacterium]MCB9355547.1 undecaprenyl-diphosphate phosphatase [Lewinellaceae bacterium]